jgi:hypothetical protein
VTVVQVVVVEVPVAAPGAGANVEAPGQVVKLALCEGQPPGPEGRAVVGQDAYAGMVD